MLLLLIFFIMYDPENTCCQSISILQLTEIMFMCIKYQQTGPNWSNYQLFLKFKYDILTFYAENKVLTIYVSSQAMEGNFLGHTL